jgi:drug/metabolite transporter (DMT)-like permease
MAPLALFLVLAGSLLHTGWNALVKGARDKLAFLWLALLPLSLTAPFLLTTDFPTAGWICLVLSGILHAVYFFALTSAYRYADLSFVYPYSRGIAAVFATLAGITFLAERPSALGFVGITLAVTAILVEPLCTRKAALDRRALQFTLLTGLATAAYLVVDKIGIRHISPLPYMAGISAVNSLLLLPLVLRDQRLKIEWRHSKGSVAGAAFFLFAAYIVVLFAMRLAPVSYVVAARASGILASAIVGFFMFNERITRPRMAGISLIVLAIVMIGLAKH